MKADFWPPEEPRRATFQEECDIVRGIIDTCLDLIECYANGCVETQEEVETFSEYMHMFEALPALSLMAMLAE